MLCSGNLIKFLSNLLVLYLHIILCTCVSCRLLEYNHGSKIGIKCSVNVPGDLAGNAKVSGLSLLWWTTTLLELFHAIAHLFAPHIAMYISEVWSTCMAVPTGLCEATPHPSAYQHWWLYCLRTTIPNLYRFGFSAGLLTLSFLITTF